MNDIYLSEINLFHTLKYKDKPLSLKIADETLYLASAALGYEDLTLKKANTPKGPLLEGVKKINHFFLRFICAIAAVILAPIALVGLLVKWCLKDRQTTDIKNIKEKTLPPPKKEETLPAPTNKRVEWQPTFRSKPAVVSSKTPQAAATKPQEKSTQSEEKKTENPVDQSSKEDKKPEIFAKLTFKDDAHKEIDPFCSAAEKIIWNATDDKLLAKPLEDLSWNKHGEEQLFKDWLSLKARNWKDKSGLCKITKLEEFVKMLRSSPIFVLQRIDCAKNPEAAKRFSDEMRAQAAKEYQKANPSENLPGMLDKFYRSVLSQECTPKQAQEKLQELLKKEGVETQILADWRECYPGDLSSDKEIIETFSTKIGSNQRLQEFLETVVAKFTNK